MKLKFNNLKRILLVSSVLAGLSAYAEPVKLVEVHGNKRIEKSTIENYIEMKVGSEYSKDKEQQSIKELFQTNLFENISISFDKGTLKVEVSEMPLVTKVDFSGNNRMKSSTLKKELLSHQGASLNNAFVKQDVEKIKEIYRKSGRYAVTVNAKIEKQENDRTKIIFEIAEGPKTGIKNINFVGNRDYRDSELKFVILTKESAWFRFLDTSDTYDPQRVEYDKILLKRFYNSIGYADFRVISVTAELSQTKENFNLTYALEEGEKYQFGNINIESNIQEIDAEHFRGFITAKKGRTYNGIELEKICEKINDQLADMGYTGAVIYPDETKNRTDRLVDVKFIIEKGSKAYINQINISGNVKTRDNVIRRQFKINEGDLFNRTAINKGEQNIRNLDYFETVSVETVPSEKGNNKADVNIKLEEKSTSSIQFEVGYNSVEGPVGRVNFVERNILGTGRYLTAGVEKYRRKIGYNAGLTDPYFLDRDLLAGISFFNMDSKGADDMPYNLQTVGGNLRAGYELKTDLRHDIIYTIKTDKLNSGRKNVPSVFIQEQYGTKTTSSIANVLTYDQTDSAIVPKNGYIVSATETVAGVGGNEKYLKHEADIKMYKSFSNNDYTIKVTGEVGKIHGYGGKKVRISDRFFLGDFSMRGFESAGLGPRDKRTGEALGAQNYYTISTEFIFPLGLPKEFNVSGSAFMDIGGLWDFEIRTPGLYSKADVYNKNAPRVSVGLGVLWVTRFAPIRIDYAFPIKKEKYDKTQHWHFRFTTSF